MDTRNHERGAALLIALLVILLLGGIGAVVITITSTETLIAGAQRHAAEASYAAEAAFERALMDLRGIGDWSLVLMPPPGNLKSTFSIEDMSPIAPDGRALDVPALLRARQTESDAAQGPDVFGADSPKWRLFGQSSLADMLPPGTHAQHAYVLVWVADEPGEGDGDASRDSNDRLLVVADAYGSGGARRSIDALIRRSPDGVVSVVTSRARH